MGRRHLSRLGAIAAAALVAAAPAAAARGVFWSPLLTGRTEPSGAQSPVGYVAATRAQEQRWTGRLEPSDRAAVARVDLSRTAVAAVFLDGLPCSSKVTVIHVTRSASTLAVQVAYTPPRVGVATCVRTSTPYLVLALRRSSLGKPVPTHVTVAAHARS